MGATLFIQTLRPFRLPDNSDKNTFIFLSDNPDNSDFPDKISHY